MKGGKFSLDVEVLSGVWSLVSLAAKNNEFVLFWLIGVILHAAALHTLNTYAWIAIAVFDWCIGALSIRSVIRPVERAFASCGISYTQEFGTPKWIIRERYPCASDTIEFTACGYPAKTYQEHVERISAGLNLPIGKVSEPYPGAQVLQAHIMRNQIPRYVDYTELDLSKLSSGKFIMGKSQDGVDDDSIFEIIHLLVAGQTGMGKTNFMQQAILTLLKTTRESHLVVIDMKGGIDFYDFKRLPNCELALTHEAAHAYLDALFDLHELRASYLAEKGKRKWNEVSLRDAGHDSRFELKPVGPIFVLIDELAELTIGSSDKKTKATIHQRLSQLGRLARATGIHLIVGTQRPDVKVLDGQTKINFSTKVCLSVPSVAASNVVIDSMAAFTIGRHPGRAVIATGMHYKMTQTPMLSSAALKAGLAPLIERLEQQQYERKVIVVKNDEASSQEKKRVSR